MAVHKGVGHYGAPITLDQARKVMAAEAKARQVTDGRAGHFRTVSAVVRVRPGAVRQRWDGSWGDNPRLDLFTGTASPSPRGRRSTAAAAPQQFWRDQLWSSAPSTAHHGNDNGACPARPSRHTVCLGGCAPHIAAAPFGATACNCPSSRARAARGNQRPSCSNGRNRYAEASRPDRQ
jgi:hypothetical protein